MNTASVCFIAFFVNSFYLMNLFENVKRIMKFPTSEERFVKNSLYIFSVMQKSTWCMLLK